MSHPDEDDARTFTRMVQEALTGPEPFDPSPGRVALAAAVREFERRERVLRFLAWGSVAFMTAIALWAAWNLLRAPESASTQHLLLYACAFLWASGGIGFAKLWLFFTQAQLTTQRELKRLELTLLDLGRERIS